MVLKNFRKSNIKNFKNDPRNGYKILNHNTMDDQIRSNHLSTKKEEKQCKTKEQQTTYNILSFLPE